MLRTLLGSLLLLASGAALADGVPLVMSAPALRAGDPALQLPRPPGFVKLHPILFASGSFGANVLIVTIDGKDYRFVGSILPAAPRQPAKPARSPASPIASASAPAVAPVAAPALPQPQFATWFGTEPGGGTLGVTKFSDGDIHATIELPPNRRLEFARPGASTVLVETDRNFYAEPLLMPLPTPATAASGVRK